jgi:ABC-type antimicrobial peptide transport system permease subunit
MKHPENSVISAALINDLQNALDGSGLKYVDYHLEELKNKNVLKLVNTIVDMVVLITIFLCFFSLSANMSANLYEQTKEIAVLRSIGLTKSRIRMLYFYEALLLVLASCMLGICIGVILGYTLTIQQT